MLLIIIHHHFCQQYGFATAMQILVKIHEFWHVADYLLIINTMQNSQ